MAARSSMIRSSNYADRINADLTAAGIEEETT